MFKKRIYYLFIIALIYAFSGRSFAVEPGCIDNDSDGYDGGFEMYSGFSGYSSACTWADCDDNDPLVNPAASETCNDTKDNDCDGLVDCQDSDCVSDPSCIVCTDADGDGYAVEGAECGPIDCNDIDPAVSPGSVESCNDEIDNDCDDQVDCADSDCTGNTACPNCVPEICDDGIDNDCDGKIDCSDKSDCNKDLFCRRGL